MCMSRHGVTHVHYVDVGCVRIDKPATINVLFISSARDTRGEDRNGAVVRTRSGPRYMRGIIETAVCETHPGGALAGMLCIKGVVTDDIERDLKGRDFSLEPQPGKWIHPFDLRLPDGAYLRDRTWHMPSEFRRLPLGAVEERGKLKRDWEYQVLRLMHQVGADIIISDHYMARIEYLFPPALAYGKVLNIHPAITLEGHQFCFRGRTPTADAIKRARVEHGVYTGATLHAMNEHIDGGPPIAYSACTPVYPDDEPQELRWRNYQMAKTPVFIDGLIHYARCIYPYLDHIDLSGR